MNEFKLTFTKAEWAELTGEQRLAIGILKTIVRDLEKHPTPALIAEVEEWLTFEGPLGPAFCDEILELADGVIAAHMRRKLELARCLIDKES